MNIDLFSYKINAMLAGVFAFAMLMQLASCNLQCAFGDFLLAGSQILWAVHWKMVTDGKEAALGFSRLWTIGMVMAACGTLLVFMYG